MSQVSSNDTFDREVYKNQKKEEKDRIFEMLSEETQALLDPEKLKAYADVQAFISPKFCFQCPSHRAAETRGNMDPVL